MFRQWQGILLTWGLVVAVGLIAIVGHERTLSEGRLVLLELAPVDPRSLMQGDYMALRFALDDQVAARTSALSQVPSYALLAVDEQGRTSLSELSDSARTEEAMVSMRLRQQGRRLTLGPNAFFFQEGTAAVYEEARWGGFRVAANGQALLVSLHDEALQPLAGQRR